jgi:hypothetical protein
VLEATHRSVTHRNLETGYECITSREYFHERYRRVEGSHDGPDTDSPARTTRHPRVHDLVMPTDGGDYRGIVVEVTPTHVRHRCLATGVVHRKGRAGFSARYRRLVTP